MDVCIKTKKDGTTEFVGGEVAVVAVRCNLTFLVLFVQRASTHAWVQSPCWNMLESRCQTKATLAGYWKGNDDLMGDTLRLFLTEEKLKNPWFSRLPAVFFMWNFSCLEERNGDSIHDAFKEVRSVGGIMLQVWGGWVSRLWFVRASGWEGLPFKLGGVNRIRFPPVARCWGRAQGNFCSI